MMRRKRLRPNPSDASSAGSSSSKSQPNADAQQPSTSERSNPPHHDMPPPPPKQSSTGQEVQRAIPNLNKQVHKTRSWYGSWPRVPKSAPSTQVAKENIFGGTTKPESTSDLTRFDPRWTPSSTLSRSPSTTSLAPSQRTIAKPQEVPEITHKDSAQKSAHGGSDSKMDVEHAAHSNDSTVVADAPLTEEQNRTATSELKLESSTPQRPSTSSGWLTWFGGNSISAPEAQSQEATKTRTADASDEGTKEEAQSNPKVPLDTVSMDNSDQNGAEMEQTEQSATLAETVPNQQASSSYWFGFWSSTTTIWTGSTPEVVPMQAPLAEEPAAPPPEDVVMADAAPPDPESNEAPQKSHPEPVKTPSEGSTWAFWSRDSRSKARGTSNQSTEAGELAIIGDGSESHPQPASSSEVSQAKAPEAAESKQKPASPVTPRAKNKRNRPQSMDIDELPVTPAKPETKNTKMGKVGKHDSVVGDNTTPAATPVKTPVQVKESSTASLPPNLLLPSFRSTYRMKNNASIMRQLADFLLRTRQPPANHVYRVKEPPKIKRAISIGVHGLFPAAYLKPIIGQPTGTSIRFANLGAEAIRRWAEANGQSDCVIEKVALEGEGKIADRVNNLWTLLLNWIEQLRDADLVIIACHSQGVPVSIILLAKLIDLGIIPNAKIGVCAMAGVTLGPFPDYKSSMGLLMGAAAELWELANPASEISKRYEAALKEVLEHGVRITFVGSIDDQLVPMESAVCSPADHPYIYRAVFIDGRIHAPDFIAHLVGFALKLRNLGVSDHGLIRELSIPLAGSLYGGEGHSRLYYDDQVYDLAVSHALETTDVPTKATCRIHKHGVLTSPNPYLLPWVMRGLLEEDFVKTELSSETDELLKQFDDWKPTTKALKDVKYRLEAVRSKL
ncbi:hypothetical protein jhhlp_000031 [Lomentospora prolificans]|uniref:YMC020W-like alpha/beta hydrolase domain-containing protein n=1 Tax=Lomentospora prolificans TaxID=41688 RepID=A0A2N3NLE1_9PEZI|nr:hypothetical protein jhhlp_000031 [Lomentospora prolificans]